MGGNTRYSRDTWKKDQLRQNINSAPKYGTKACNLCERGRLPDDLYLKVSKYKNCADVNLELSLLKPSTATCEAGQDLYREICCAQPRFELPEFKAKPTIGVAVGLILFFIFTKKARRIQCAPPRGDHKTIDEEGGIASKELVRGRSNYKQMKDDASASSGSRKSRLRSRSKSRDRAGSRSKSRDRAGSRSKSRDRGSLQRCRSGGSRGSNRTAKKNNRSHDFKKQQVPPQHPKAAIHSSASIALKEQQRRIQQRFQEQLQRKQSKNYAADSEDDAYYHLDDDPSLNDSSTLADNTAAGYSIDAVVTQVV